MSKKLGIGIVVILLIGVILGIYLLSKSQDIRQRAAGTGADLVITNFQLTDAAGNVKTKFYENEDVYVRVSIKNEGTEVGTSATGRTISQVYAHKSSPAAFGALSDVGVSLNNGEFQPGAVTKHYESRINGRNQGVYVSDPYDPNSSRKYSWRKSSANNYTARLIINSDKAVTETDYTNNQLTIPYQVVPFTQADEIGTQSLTKPADFDNFPCLEKPSAYIPGLTGCIQRVNNAATKVEGRVTNNTAVTQKVYIASFKAYLPYTSPDCAASVCPAQYDFNWTQTFYRAEGYDLRPGDTVYLSTNVPSCAWQADIFVGDFPKSLHPNIPTYGSGIGYIDGWYNFYPNYDQANTTYCTADTPEPTPTSSTPPSVTPTSPPTATPTPGPSITPPSGTPPTATPTTPACIPPAQVQNVRISCPNCTP